jgi:DNA polymerase-3 subunit gamma/tau
MDNTFYTKYRPKTFDEVVGQKNIKDFFSSSIGSSNFHHAYIFSGPRGTGKTTIARIVAKILNCQNPITLLQSTNPCNNCHNCLAIDGGYAMDILELDAASNRGIDDIREIQQKTMSRPMESKYKIFIIDEIHSLTPQSFEALLKTVEEPPDYVVFIFCTTNFHKIPETIRSRCEKLFFKRIEKEDLRENIQRIIKTENIDISEESINLIIDNSDGIARESVSNLNQLVSQFGKEISDKDVNDSFGILDNNMKKELVKAFLENNDVKIHEIISDVSNKSINIDFFMSDIINTIFRIIPKISDRQRKQKLNNLLNELSQFDLSIKDLTKPYPFVFSLFLKAMGF